jgi:hypothetical protein
VTNGSGGTTIISTIQRSQSYSAAESLQYIGTSHQHGQLKSEQKVLAIWMHLHVTFIQPANNYYEHKFDIYLTKTRAGPPSAGIHRMARRTLWAFSWIHSRCTGETGREFSSVHCVKHMQKTIKLDHSVVAVDPHSGERSAA